MAKFLIFIGSSVVVILIFAFAIKKNNYPSQAPVVQNVLREEINNQEEIIKEVVNNSTILDNTIINLIIFLLIFVIAIIFIFLSDYSPLKNNNDHYTGDIFNRSLLRKTGFFNGEIFFKRIEYFYQFYDKNNKEVLLKLRKIEDNDGYQYEFENYPNNENKKGKAIETLFKQKIDHLTPEQIENIKKDVSDTNKKQSKIYDCFQVSRGTEYLNVSNFYPFNTDQYNYQEYFKVFKGKVDFFNRYNIFAFLLNSLLFFISFGIPYFVFHFLYTLIYAFLFLDEKEIKKNKFLFAFYRALKALFFLNFRGLLKIIPGFLFLIILLLIGILFFINGVFYPIIYDISDPNVKKTAKPINFFNEHWLRSFLRDGKIEVNAAEW